MTWLTAQEVHYSTMVYDVTLNTNRANSVNELFDKTPFRVLSGALFTLVSIKLKTLFMIAILRAGQLKGPQHSSPRSCLRIIVNLLLQEGSETEQSSSALIEACTLILHVHPIIAMYSVNCSKIVKWFNWPH